MRPHRRFAHQPVRQRARRHQCPGQGPGSFGSGKGRAQALFARAQPAARAGPESLGTKQRGGMRTRNRRFSDPDLPLLYDTEITLIEAAGLPETAHRLAQHIVAALERGE
jgi:hypothetical protein